MYGIGWFQEDERGFSTPVRSKRTADNMSDSVEAPLAEARQATLPEASQNIGPEARQATLPEASQNMRNVRMATLSEARAKRPSEAGNQRIIYQSLADMNLSEDGAELQGYNTDDVGGDRDDSEDDEDEPHDDDEGEDDDDDGGEDVVETREDGSRFLEEFGSLFNSTFSLQEAIKRLIDTATNNISDKRHNWRQTS